MMGEKKPKKKGMKIIMGIVGLFLVLGIVGVVSYNQFGQTGLVAYITKWITDSSGNLVKNPAYEDLQKYGAGVDENGDKVTSYQNEVNRANDLGLEAPSNPNQNNPTKGTTADSCNGCFNNQWQVWKNGSCTLTGSCGTNVAGKDTTNPNIDTANDSNSCTTYGGQWCSSIDARGTSYSFCMENDGSKGTCNTQAIERGYVVLTGSLSSIGCTCVEPNGTKCDTWTLDSTTYDLVKDYGADVVGSYTQQCYNYTGFGTGAHICQVGVAGDGNEVYSGGSCTSANGTTFSGNIGCFCGTVQIDNGTGHVSYSSTCGCDKEVKTTTFTSSPSPSPSPSPITPTLMCDGLTSTPATTPALGDTVTLTCAGSSSPAGTIDLSYKFRYSVNNGSFAALNNKTATTAEITIAACGDYTVQCQTCGVINGTQVCDPDWSSALVQ